ncbi:MAG: sigma-70 family RNA polymerase sigma factor [Nocardioides sp.]
MTASGGTSDAALVEGVLNGDRDAFAQVYERYADRLFDFAHGMLRDREDAADAVADSFVTMADRLHQLRDHSRLRPWLYAVTRRECLRRLKARGRIAFSDDERMESFPDAAASPEQQVETAELRELVWDAAAGLGERDRVVLDLHLRHGLEGQELAEAMGISAGNAYVSLNRLRGQVERSLGALLIARLGRDDCAELGSILEGWDGNFSVLLRKRVARHVDQCLVCRERRAVLSPLSVIAGVPLLVAPASLRDRVLGDLRLVGLATEDPSGGSPQRHAGPRASAGRVRRLVRAAPVIAAAVAIAVLVTAWLTTPGSDAGRAADDPTPAVVTAPSGSSPTPPSRGPQEPTPSEDNPDRATSTPSEAPPTSTTSAPEAAPTGLELSPPLLDLGEVSRAGDVTLTNIGTRSLKYGFATSVAWVIRPSGGSLGPGESITVSIFVDRSRLPPGTSEAVVEATWAGGSMPIVIRAAMPTEPSAGPTLTAPGEVP